MEEEQRTGPEITVAIPCYNEELTIAKVIRDFHAELPEAEIIVFDNNSTDNSVKAARESGARVVLERRQGKGYVMQKMFRTLEADIFVLVDGDDTYFAKDVHELLKPIRSGAADMVVGNRLLQKKGGFTVSHRFGNLLFKYLLNYLFKAKFADVLSGYRVMTKEFYQSIPLLAKGFEIETELTLQSLERSYQIVEVPIQYQDRPAGSHSKLKKITDGYQIILTIIALLRDYRPMVFFSYLGGLFIVLGVGFGGIVVDEYIRTGTINRVPTAILSVMLVLIGVNAIISGLILSAVNRRQRETEVIIRQMHKR